MSEMYANLHFHSTHSDGCHSPKELVGLAAREGYQALALTDHETPTGWAEFREACAQQGMDCIPAVEFSCLGLDTDFHIVAFDFDPDNPRIQAHIQHMCDKMAHRTHTLLERALEAGRLANITWEEVLTHNPGIRYLCNDHVFRAMLQKGVITKEEYPDFFRNNFIWKIPCESPYDPPRVEDLLETICQAGGVAVLAHPHNQLHHVEALMNLGLKGIETHHPALPDDEIQQAEALALAKGLYISGGTDHSGVMDGHGTGKPIPSLKYGATQENFLKLKNRVLG